jgi:hypothetical protein
MINCGIIGVNNFRIYTSLFIGADGAIIHVDIQTIK